MSIKDYSADLKSALQDAEQADLFCHYEFKGNYEDYLDYPEYPEIFASYCDSHRSTNDELDCQMFLDDDYPF